MIKKLFPILILLFSACETETDDEKENFITPFEISEGKETATYEQTIAFYMELALEYPQIHIQTMGDTDSGYPLHLVTYNKDANFNYQKLAEEKTVILINNGIHPGESDGVDASMLLFRDLAREKLSPPEDVVVITIPIYNIGGSLNRSQKTRVNQNGPEVHGFRANSRNYDLNRDFIKCDTKNARTFTEIFHLVKPDIFVDNHVSNGADYQYTLTHLFTQHNKLGAELGDFMEEEMIPSIEENLAAAGREVTPYVNVYNKPPDNGFSQFMDYPRYSSGYAALWNTLGLMIETHMLKPFDKRVLATYDFLVEIIKFSQAEHEKIKSLRATANTQLVQGRSYPLKWELDSTRYRTLKFKGFQADTVQSAVTGFDRLKYDQNTPIELEIPYFNQYRAIDSVYIPSAYLIGREWEEVIDLLDLNLIKYSTLENDTVIEVESYRIKDYQTSPNSYEGHYPHYNTSVSDEIVKIGFQAGDIMVPTDQQGIRYLLEVFEPEATDSFFNWNFFDPILQQKEGFSAYVFEDLALQLLEENPNLRDSFEMKKKQDDLFKEDGQAQLKWIYRQSEYYENSFMQYPVYRILRK